MKRIVRWLLGGLAVGAAISAVRRPAAEEVAGDTGAATLPASGDGPAAPAVPAVPAERPHARRLVLRIAKRLQVRFRQNNTALIAGSLAYYAMLSVFPAAIAAVAIYGLVLSPEGLEEQIADIATALPADASSLVLNQLRQIVAGSGSGLGIAAVVSIGGALWSASAGVKALIVGINVAYDVDESRSFLVLRATALLITLGSILFVGSAVAAVTFLPELPGIGDASASAIAWLRWPVIFVVVLFGLGAMYKLAPNRPARTFPWLSIGAAVAAVTWVLMTVGFSFYVTNLGNFNATYGTLGGVIVLMLWFFLSGFSVLLGAELNAELEHADIH